MYTLDHRIVREDQRFPTDLENGGIVGQAAGGGVRRDAAQGVDEGGLAAQARTSFATASSTPLTNFASRSSKNAFATSTHSLIAAATGTSGRASTS